MIVQIHTDASFNQFDKKGGYAIWIVAGSLITTKSGIFEKEVGGSTQAEFEAMIKSIHIVLSDPNIKSIDRIQFYNDAVTTHFDHKIKNHNSLQRNMYLLLAELYSKKSVTPKDVKGFQSFFSFRHIPGHDKKNLNDDILINWWCHRMATRRLKNKVNEI